MQRRDGGAAFIALQRCLDRGKRVVTAQKMFRHADRNVRMRDLARERQPGLHHGRRGRGVRAARKRPAWRLSGRFKEGFEPRPRLILRDAVQIAALQRRE
jgi:hypothetical protein